MNKCYGIIGILLSLIIFIPSCNYNKTIHLGIILKTHNNQFYDELLLGIQKKAIEHNLDINVFYGKNEDDWQGQRDNLNNNKDKVDAFILTPNNSEKLAATILKLKDINKPVVVVSDSVDGKKINALSSIRVDSLLGGKLAGQYVSDKIIRNNKRKNCIVLMTGNLNSNDHRDRKEGFLSLIRLKLPKAKIYEFDGYSNYHTAYKIMEKNLNLAKSCYAFFAASDTMIMGIRKAFVEHKINQKEKILVGFDGITDIQKMIMKDEIDATIKQETFKMGELAVENIYNYFNVSKTSIPTDQIISPKLLVKSNGINSLSEKDLKTILK